MDVTSTNNNKLVNGREMLRQESAKQTNAQTQARATEQTDGRKKRQTFAAQVTKSTLSSNGNNARGNVDLKILTTM